MYHVSLQHKQFWMSNALIVASLLFAALFPTDGGFQSVVSVIAFLVVLPTIFIRFFLREKLSDFGVSWGNMMQGMSWLAVSLLVVAGSFAVLQHFTDVLSHIQIPLSVRRNFAVFLIYLVSTGIFLAVQEFFFRGFILNTYKKVFGYAAIFAQIVFSVLFLLIKTQGSVGIDTIVVSILSLYSGWIAYRSRSIWYSFFFFFISAILGMAIVLVFIK